MKKKDRTVIPKKELKKMILKFLNDRFKNYLLETEGIEVSNMEIASALEISRQYLSKMGQLPDSTN